MGVYFIKSENNLMKIGKSKDFDQRFKALQANNPFKLEKIIYIPCDDKIEFQLHGVFSDNRKQGEWFTICDKMKSLVIELLLDKDNAEKIIIKHIESFYKEVKNSIPYTSSEKNKISKVRKRIVITDYDFDEKEYAFELLHYEYGRTDQYMIRVDGKQLFYDRQNRMILDRTPKPVVMGLHAVHKLAMSKFHKIRRLY